MTRPNSPRALAAIPEASARTNPAPRIGENPTRAVPRPARLKDLK
jgi:hypothetical protein